MFELVKFLPTHTYYSSIKSSGPFFTEKDYPDLAGQKWVVTGATGGIGLELAKIFVKQNAELWIVGRSVQKLDAAVETLKKLQPSAIVHTVVIDYSDLTSVKPGAEKIKTEAGHLNGIIHNAGVMNVPKDSKTKQGFELTLGVNNLATQLLQDLLDPAIVDTPNARVVWLSSSVHINAPSGGFDPKVIKCGSSWSLYAMSKALDYIQAVQWTHTHPDAKTVKSIAVHPGAIRSDLTRSTSPVLQSLTSFMYHDTPWGAHAPIYAALSPEAENNSYVIPFGRPGKIRPDVYSAARDKRGEEALAWVEKQIKPYK